MNRENERAHAGALAYRPDVDGLRAIAVLAVLVYHAFPRRLSGGFVGVDVFFVISGFLISSIIRKALDDGTFTFGWFYGRRIKRIFPALIVVLATCLPVGWLVLFPDEFRTLGKHAAAGAGFVYNFIAWTEAGYFNPEAPSTPLLHFWSLGVEEQFYFVWPLVLLVAHRRGASLPVVVGILLAASFVLNVALVHDHPVETFYFPFTRLWELAAGSLLAVVAARAPVAAPASSGHAKTWIAWAGLLGLGASLFLIDTGKEFPGWWAVLPTLSTVLLIATGPDTWLHRRLLANRVAVFIGLISYPLYLWHWPLLSFAHLIERGIPPGSVRLAMVVAAFVLAWLTYVAIEIPVRFRGRTGPRAIALAAIASVLLGIGLLIRFDQVPRRFSDDRVAFMDHFDNSDFRVAVRYADAYRDDCNFYDFRRNRPRDAIDRSCWVPSSPKSVLLWGDSHASQFAYGLRNTLPRDFSVLHVGASGCRPSLDAIPGSGFEYCNRTNEFALDVVRQAKPPIVILAQAGLHERTDWEDLARRLRAAGAGRVILLGPVPQWKPALNKVIASAYWESTPSHIATHLDPDPFETDARLGARYANGTELAYVSMVAGLCDRSGCLAYLEGDRREGITTWDTAHLTPAASEYVASRLISPVVVAAMGRLAP